MLICANDKSGLGTLLWMILLGKNFKEVKNITAVDNETGYYAWTEPAEFGVKPNAHRRHVKRCAISPRIRIYPTSLLICIL